MKVYKNFLTKQEIGQLINYKNSQPISSTKYTETGEIKALHTNINYDKDGVVKNILHEKLDQIFAGYSVDTGSFLESITPYGLHVDTNRYHAKTVGSTRLKKINHSQTLLIPLDENLNFETIIFDHHTQELDKEKLKKLPNIQQDLKFDCDHLSNLDSEIIKKIKIVGIYKWQKGDLLAWPREQLHCSNNFRKYANSKQALVIFID